MKGIHKYNICMRLIPPQSNAAHKDHTLIMATSFPSLLVFLLSGCQVEASPTLAIWVLPDSIKGDMSVSVRYSLIIFAAQRGEWIVVNRDYTVKRPKFDILSGENIFFLQNLFRWPPLNFFGGVSKIQIYGKMKWKIRFSHCKVPKKTLFCRWLT